MRRILLMMIACGVCCAQAAEIDPVSGLPMNEDWQLVRAHCTGCHSSKLIVQQRGTADRWLRMIRWMQDSQNLWQFDAETERKIVDYLATSFPPVEGGRRASIPPDLMPPNPFKATAEE